MNERKNSDLFEIKSDNDEKFSGRNHEREYFSNKSYENIDNSRCSIFI